jgi:hypothetical protein
MSGKLISGPKVGYDLARLGAGAARGANRKNQLNAAAWSGTWPAPGSSLDLDFVNNRGWVRGSGQGGVMDAITFTRASNATYVGEDGLLKSYSNQGALGKNLLTFPQDFDNSWVTLNSTVNKNATLAPDNTFSAVKLIENTNNGLHYVRQVNGTGFIDQTVTFSVYIKKSERNWAYLYSDLKVPNPLAYFDLQNGVTGTAVDCTSNIVDFGDDWYRCSITFATTLVGSAFAALVGIATENSGDLQSYVGDGTSGIFIWGAQLEEGDQATEYFPTNIGVPRFDWGSTDALPIQNELTFSSPDNIFVWNSLTSDFGITTGVNYNTSIGMNGTLSGATLQDSNSFLSRTLGSILGNKRITLHCNPVSGSNITVTFRNPSAGGTSTLVFNPNTSTFTQSSGSSVSNLSLVLLDNGFARLSFINSNIGGNMQIRVSGGANDVIDGFQINNSDLSNEYFQTGAGVPSRTPLAANPTPNGILIEESRTNRVLWCRDATQTVPYTPPDNFFAQSETFTNASWNFDSNQTQLVRTENQSDPFDGTSATKIVPNAGRTAANAYIGQRSGASYPSTHSLYAKAAEYDYLVLSLFTYIAGNFAVFNLSDGTITTSPTAAGLTAAIESVGDGWYRCSLTTSNETLNRGFLVSVSPNGTTTATAAGGSGIFIYGAHSNNGNTPTTYVQTTVLDSPLWVLTDITAAKDQTGIDGVANAASSLTATDVNGTCFQYITLLSGARTCSAYLKRITGTGVVQVSLDEVTWSTVDLSDTEWRRVVLSGTVTNPVLGIRLIVSGDVIAMDYAQVEDGSIATTPILTTSATVTRAADIADLTDKNFGSWYNPKECTLSVESFNDYVYKAVVAYPTFVNSPLSMGVTFVSSDAFSSGWGLRTSTRGNFTIDSQIYFFSGGGTDESALILNIVPVRMVTKMSGSVLLGTSFTTSYFGLVTKAYDSVTQFGSRSVLTAKSLRIGTTFLFTFNGTVKRIVYHPKCYSDTVVAELSQ